MKFDTPEHFTGVIPTAPLREMDILSPHEFWLEHQRRSLQQPEVMLMMAVLEDALKCYFDYAGASSRRQSRLFDQTEQWFFSKDDEELFSFENVCTVFGIDPNYIRRGLLLFRKGSSRRWGRRKKISSKPRAPVIDSNTIKSPR